MSYDSGVTPADIRDVFETQLDDSALETWIAAAETQVSDLPAHDALTSDRKEQITKFLAPALATAQDPRVDREQHESATVSYKGERRQYIDVATMLDPTNSIGTEDTPDATAGTFEVR